MRLHESLWAAYNGQPRKKGGAIRVAAKDLGDAISGTSGLKSSGIFGSPIDFVVRALPMGLPEGDRRSKGEQIVKDLTKLVEGVDATLGGQEEHLVREALIERLFRTKRALLLKWHPDKNQGDLETATEMTQFINKVFEHTDKRGYARTARAGSMA